jgi:serine/threonine protein kinase
MGEVYKATDPRLDRIVAIKLASEKFSDRFQREARSIAALNHPNICQIYAGPNYIVMELVEGEPIAPPDSARKLLDIAVQVADGLAAAHALYLIHRDLKPDNILLTRDGRVKILDFGLAQIRNAPAESENTATMMESGPLIMGTVGYMSPEQVRGEKATAASDIFGLGCVLYEVVTGRRAFSS